MALRNLLRITREMRLLLEKKRDMLSMRTQSKSNISPSAGWFGEMFKVKTVMEYWEIIPVIVTTAVAVVMPIVHIGFIIYKSNDLRLWPGHHPLVEKHQYIIDGAPPPCHRYMVINQKYEWPCGLLKALKDDVDCDDDEVRKVSFKFWRKDTKRGKRGNE